MAIDLNKMRAKLDALQNRGEKKDSSFWRPQEGEQTIRIVPTADGDPFKEYWFHYNLGKNPGFLSPKRNFGTDDPLNDFVRQLFNEGTDDSIKQAKQLMARQRFFAPVLVRGEEEKGVRIWGNCAPGGLPYLITRSVPSSTSVMSPYSGLRTRFRSS